nr:RNA polymerase sigma-70 factor [Dysgonomonas sp. Marseille-P4677]
MDEKEFEHTFNLYYHSLCKYLYLFTTDFTLIEDVVQSAFLKLWEDRENVSITNIRAYLYLVVRNRIINAIRNNRNRKNLLEDFFIEEMINEEATDIIDFEEFYEKVQESVNLLPEKAKIVYRLVREEKFSYKEIAKKHNVSVKTIENQMSYALKCIRDNLKSYYEIIMLFISLVVNCFF